MEAAETLRKIEEVTGKPEAMGYFYELLGKVYASAPSWDPGTNRIGTMCVQVPDELIYAAGAVPMRLCNGANAYDQAGAEFMPAKSCSVIRAAMGILHINPNGLHDALTAVIVPTTCDLKRKAGAIIQEMGLDVHYLEMPSSKESSAAGYYWQESVKRFAIALQKITGQKITKKGLVEAIGKIREASAQFRRLYELRKADPPVISGVDAFLVTSAYLFDNIENWTMAVAELNRELEKRRKQSLGACNRPVLRFLFTGSPPIFPNIRVPIIVEQTGAVIVADDTCSGSRLLYDTVYFDEPGLYDMIPAVADRYLKPCTCPCLAPNTDRERKLLDMAATFAVDGVIYQAFSGCHPYEMEQKRISAVLSQKGVQMLYLETDYSPEDTGQISTRVDAFVESIRAIKT
jgi:benzoyl-CoA reductase/2-hydroxyglutaryl-CoA dehydratase subunit BcrC/BadD/HgdB